MPLELLELLEKWLMIYVDNFLLSTVTCSEHLEALYQRFQMLRHLHIKYRWEKCQFMENAIWTLGFEVSQGVIKPDHKIGMLWETPTPKSKADLKTYLYLIQFYQNMLPHLAHPDYQLYAVTSENFTFQWTDTLQKAFDATKDL